MRTIAFPLSMLMVVALLLTSCANKVTPRGGEVDKDAPKLSSSTPGNYATNFTGKEIVLQFDEYVQLKEQQTQLVISPAITPAPEVTAIKKSVVIRFKDTPPANTTYTFNFGKSIADIHEGNPLDQFEYVFSTGAVLDSASVSGIVLNAATHAPVKDAVVLLYKHEEGKAVTDTPGVSRRPDYFGRTNDAGGFFIRNVPQQKYTIAALSEKNNNFLLDDYSAELLAFSQETVDLSNEVHATRNLFVSKQRDPRLVLKSTTRLERNRALFIFNRAADAVELLPLGSTPLNVSTEWNVRRDSLFVITNDTLRDSLQCIMKGENLQDTVTVKMKTAGTVVKLRISSVQVTASPESAGPSSPFELTFPTPVQIDLAAFKVYKDTTLLALPADAIQRDPVSRRKVTVRYNWQEGASYKIMLPKGAASDGSGWSNDSTKWTFTVLSAEKSAELTVHIPACTASGKLQLQILTEKYDVIRELPVQSGATVKIPYLNPGTAILRLIDDRNGNALFDEGDVIRGVLPEAVSVTGTLTLRANWELESTLVCPEPIK